MFDMHRKSLATAHVMFYIDSEQVSFFGRQPITKINISLQMGMTLCYGDVESVSRTYIVITLASTYLTLFSSIIRLFRHALFLTAWPSHTKAVGRRRCNTPAIPYTVSPRRGESDNHPTRVFGHVNPGEQCFQL